jgi:3-oxoacyl-[acyl-carrier-protein] synthase II
MPSKRVAITGTAASTWLGVGTSHLFGRLSEGLWARPYDICEAGAKRFPPLTYDIADLIRKTRTDHELTRQLFAAVDCDLGADLAPLDNDSKARAGVVIGNSSGHIPSYLAYYTTAIQEGYERVNPVHFPATLVNYSTAQLSSGYALQGSGTTISSGFGAGLDAIGYATLRLQRGQDHLLLAGGIEALNPYNLGLLKRHDAVSVSGRMRPLHEDRDGIVAAEGIGVLQLEPLLRAQQAGHKKVLGEVLGYHAASGYRRKGEAVGFDRIVSAISQLLQMAELSPGDVEAIFPSANGSIMGDALEARVLRHLFGAHLDRIPIYPVKALVGECFTAAGPLQCMAALYALTLPPSLPRETPPTSVSGIDGLLLLDTIVPCRKALIYSMGLDGTFAALILGKVDA